MGISPKRRNLGGFLLKGEIRAARISPKGEIRGRISISSNLRFKKPPKGHKAPGEKYSPTSDFWLIFPFRRNPGGGFFLKGKIRAARIFPKRRNPPGFFLKGEIPERISISSNLRFKKPPKGHKAPGEKYSAKWDLS